jgi:23S rRNA pseudouridine2605 synthase
LKAPFVNPTVYHLLPEKYLEDGWVPVGRLDKDSCGLLILVKEGHLVSLLQKPGFCEKVYEVTVRGPVEPHHLVALHQGVETALGVMKVHSAEILGNEGQLSYLRVVLNEGKNRQIRRIFNALRDSRLNKPLKVMALKRVGFGNVGLDLEEGKWRFLGIEETERLLRPI